MTLQLLWEEYKQEYPAGYSYSRFSERTLRRMVEAADVVLRPCTWTIVPE